MKNGYHGYIMACGKKQNIKRFNKIGTLTSVFEMIITMYTRYGSMLEQDLHVLYSVHPL